MIAPARGSRIAFPTTQPTDADLDELVARHRAAVLRDAEATLTVLDWKAYTDGRTLHVIDARDTGAPARGYLGFTCGAQLHELARHLLPTKRSTRPAAAVAVNVDALVLCLRLQPSTEAREGETVDRLRAAAAAVAAHELAHVIAAQATGRRLHEGATLQQSADELSTGRSYEPAQLAASHGPEWLRAYCHLVTRARRLPGYVEWIHRFASDVAAVLPHAATAYIDALGDELAAHTCDDPLVDIIRTPAPAGFLTLFPARDAARPATEET